MLAGSECRYICRRLEVVQGMRPVQAAQAYLLASQRFMTLVTATTGGHSRNSIDTQNTSATHLSRASGILVHNIADVEWNHRGPYVSCSEDVLGFLRRAGGLRSWLTTIRYQSFGVCAIIFSRHQSVSTTLGISPKGIPASACKPRNNLDTNSDDETMRLQWQRESDTDSMRDHICYCAWNH